MDNKNAITPRGLSFDELEPVDQLLVMGRLEGMNFVELKKASGMSYQYVWSGFQRHGRLYHAYVQLRGYLRKENKNRFKKLQKKIEDYTPQALDDLHRASKKGKWQASVAILALAGFVPTQKSKVEVDSPELTKAAQIIDEVAIYVRESLTSN